MSSELSISPEQFLHGFSNTIGFYLAQGEKMKVVEAESAEIRTRLETWEREMAAQREQIKALLLEKEIHSAKIAELEEAVRVEKERVLTLERSNINGLAEPLVKLIADTLARGVVINTVTEETSDSTKEEVEHEVPAPEDSDEKEDPRPVVRPAKAKGKRGGGNRKKCEPGVHRPELAWGPLTLGSDLVSEERMKEAESDEFLAARVCNCHDNITRKTGNRVHNRKYAIHNLMLGFNMIKEMHPEAHFTRNKANRCAIEWGPVRPLRVPFELGIPEIAFDEHGYLDYVETEELDRDDVR